MRDSGLAGDAWAQRHVETAEPGVLVANGPANVAVEVPYQPPTSRSAAPRHLLPHWLGSIVHDRSATHRNHHPPLPSHRRHAMSTADVSAALDALEALASTSATSSSGPLNALLEQHFAVARERILAGSPPKHVIAELQTNIAKAKKQVERGLKTWYAALGNTGKAVEKVSSASVTSCVPVNSSGWRVGWRSDRVRTLLTSGLPSHPLGHIVSLRRPAPLY